MHVKLNKSDFCGNVRTTNSENSRCPSPAARANPCTHTVLLLTPLVVPIRGNKKKHMSSIARAMGST